MHIFLFGSYGQDVSSFGSTCQDISSFGRGAICMHTLSHTCIPVSFVWQLYPLSLGIDVTIILMCKYKSACFSVLHSSIKFFESKVLQ